MRSATASIETSAEQKGAHKFFDQKSPARPEQICGVDTDAILRVGRAALDLGVLSPKVNLGLITLPNVTRLVPLIEEMQAGVELSPEDIRPYRKPIKKLSPELGFADKAVATLGVLAVGVPLRRALNRKIEREFSVRASEAVDKARETVASIENEVNIVASFENPREQFVNEVSELRQMTTKAIAQERDIRVSKKLPAQSAPETLHGFRGFITKIVRKVRSFFGFIKRAPKVTREITAYDAGAGIEKVVKFLRQNTAEVEEKLPMLSKLVLSKIPQKLSITKDHLAFAAPEILDFLFSTSEDEDESQALIDSVLRNPHELRFVTRYKKYYKGYSLDRIQRASRTLFPAIRDFLPTTGQKVRDIFDEAQSLLRKR